MSKNTFITAAVLAVMSTGAMAQQFTGGELGAEYNTFTDGVDFDGASYNAAVEFAFNRQISLALDVDKVDLGDTSSDPRVTAHGIYHLGSSSSVGVFYSETIGSDVDSSAYGLEGGTEFMRGDIGGYVGIQNIGDEDVVAFGLNSQTPVYDSISVFTDFDLLADDNVGVSTSEIGAIYEIANGPELYAQFGQLTAYANGGSASENYVGIGARISFGAARGTTFEGR